MAAVKPFDTVLIANRGEIACRIIRTLRDLGMRSVAVYAEPDAGALHTRMADDAMPIPSDRGPMAYLDGDAIIMVAKERGAGAIHPGYGFLSENAAFAQACVDADITFVGPTPDAIRAMGSKDQAKALMIDAGVPVVPGYHGEKQDPEFLRRKAYEIGYPVLIKAVAGGGGRGMRRVDKAKDFDEALQSAVREAEGAFGNGAVLIEKYVLNPRHIEVQVFGDSHGSVVHLFERDCSVQRRHQKVIEEAPAPGMTTGLRARLTEAAVAAAKAVDYRNAGTVEFVVDGSGPLHDGTDFYFLEMNTRLQVEHPVTEMITGLDLVAWQIAVAQGNKLPITQDAISLSGHAIELRLTAEDTENGFLPSHGQLLAFDCPQGESLRFDTGLGGRGDVISPHYDSMVAKLIAHGATRKDALMRARAGAAATRLAGPKTNIPFLLSALDSDGFQAGGVDTGFVATLDEASYQLLEVREQQLVAQAVSAVLRAGNPVSGAEEITGGGFGASGGFALMPRPEVARTVTVDGHPVTLTAAAEGMADPDTVILRDPARRGVMVLWNGFQRWIEAFHFAAEGTEDGAGDGVLRAPMHGKVTAINVAQGDRVESGQTLAVVEAMKMENPVKAPGDGLVIDVPVAEGTTVEAGQAIIVLEPAEENAEAD
ncbi:MAG: biotin carboxylase N-terminal domain-containing protein [Pseudomonadota bacterium]